MGRRKQAKQERKRLKELEQIAIEEARKRRNSGMLGWISGACAIFLAGGISYNIIDTSLFPKEKEVAESPAEIPDEISFEQAVANESWRQPYLDRIVEIESEDLPEWDCFAKVTYDRGFKNYERETGRKVRMGESCVQVPIPDKKKLVVPAFVYAEKIGIKPNCYVSEWAFSGAAESEDELISLLDNEAANACMAKVGKLPLSVKLGKGHVSELTKQKAAELFSFDYQFRCIKAGKRNVSKGFQHQCVQSYAPLYFEFKEMSQKDDSEGRFASAVMQSLKIHMSMKERGR